MVLGTRPYLGLVLNLVSGLLELADLSYDVRNLSKRNHRSCSQHSYHHRQHVPVPRRVTGSGGAHSIPTSHHSTM